MPTLAVIGAGPKGIAIAKARALAAVGLDAPEAVLVERCAFAGNWTGRQGYTSGLLPLGTPPEKDVGFPYADSWGAASSAVTAAMAEFSWQRHLIARGVYADWVDRGRMVEPGEAITADGIVLTGSGPPITVPGQPLEHPRVFDGRSYWLHEQASKKQVAESVCVIGSGETAASIVISLLKSHTSARRSTS